MKATEKTAEDLQKENAKIQQESADSAFKQQAKFQALHSVPVSKVDDDGRQRPLTDDEIVSAAGKIYNWLIQ